jgi:hypothetical protein
MAESNPSGTHFVQQTLNFQEWRHAALPPGHSQQPDHILTQVIQVSGDGVSDVHLKICAELADTGNRCRNVRCSPAILATFQTILRPCEEIQGRSEQAQVQSMGARLPPKGAPRVVANR